MRILFVHQNYPGQFKHLAAHFARDPEWTTVRPPLVELDPGQHRALITELTDAGFDMPGLAG